MKYLKFVVLTLSIISTAMFGDYIVFKSKYSSSQVFRALCDSITHGSIGCLSAVLFFCYETNLSSHAWLYNVLLCTILSSFIDIDHVIVAKSFYWKDITNTKQRGILHCTTFWLVFVTILFFISYYHKKVNLYVLNWMIIIAFTSHHVRDACRRGFWVYPFGHTKPITYNSYLVLSAMLPSIFSVIYNYLKPYIFKYTTVEFYV